MPNVDDIKHLLEEAEEIAYDKQDFPCLLEVEDGLTCTEQEDIPRQEWCRTCSAAYAIMNARLRVENAAKVL